MANEHRGHRNRVRDRVRKEGLDNFQDYQVLEYALMFPIPYKDTNVLAHRLIKKFGSLAGVLETKEEDLMQVEGMGEVSAHFLANLLNIYHYYKKDSVDLKATITSPGDTYRFIKPFLSDKLTEQLYLICISPKNIVVSVEKISEGSMTESNVNIRTIIDKMSSTKVSNIIIAHNHPKGICTPSPSDDQITKALVTNLCISGGHLLDHMIIGEPEDFKEGEDIESLLEEGMTISQLIESRSFYSYQRAGLIDKYKKEASDFVSMPKVSQPCAKYGVNK